MPHQWDKSQQSGVIDSQMDDQSSSSNSLSEDENYSNFLVPVSRSSSIQTDPMYHGEAAIRNDSISASARTAVTSNIRWLSTLSRDCISPPNCIDADDDINHTRSIFGKNIQRKYNLRQGEILESRSRPMPHHYNQLYQTPISSNVDTNVWITPATLSKEKNCTVTLYGLPETLGRTTNALNEINRPKIIQQHQQQNKQQQQHHHHAQSFLLSIGFFSLLLLLVVIWLACRPRSSP